MKTCLLLIIGSLLITNAKSQIKNTSWRGIYNVPEPTPMILQFKTDTLLLIDQSGANVETMNYTIKNDTLSISMIEGASSCPNNITGVYKIEIKEEDKLFISVINDNCDNRVNSLPNEPLTLIKR